MSAQIPTKQLGIGGLMVATEGLVTNKTLLLADTEYAHVLQDGVKQIIISARNSAVVRVAFNPGETATAYKTIWRGGCWTIEYIKFSSKILYLRADKANTILEIVEFI